MLDRAYMQFLTFMDDPAYRDEHRVHVELIHTLARVGPNTEPKFREECKSLPYITSLYVCFDLHAYIYLTKNEVILKTADTVTINITV